MKKLWFLMLFAASCGDDPKNAPPIDAAPAPDMAPAAPTCFQGTPATHDQIINACVDQSVTVIHKTPSLPLLNADGSLPPLP